MTLSFVIYGASFASNDPVVRDLRLIDRCLRLVVRCLRRIVRDRWPCRSWSTAH